MKVVQTSLNPEETKQSEESLPLSQKMSVDFRQSTQTQRLVKQGGFRAQFRAILLKNYALQKTQPGTNCCQLITPFVCLFLIYLIKYLATSRITSNTGFTPQIDFPYLLNFPCTSGLEGPIYCTDCTQWYMYDFADGTSATTKFIVETLLYNVIPSNIVGYNLFQCGSKPSPSFQKGSAYQTGNQELYNILENLNNNQNANTDILPDGVLTFSEASESGLVFNIQINDGRSLHFHRNNGVTRVEYVVGSDVLGVYIIPYGQLALINLVSETFLRQFDENQMILTAVQPMPTISSAIYLLNLLFNITGSTLYPIALSLLLPVFMYALVLEKEERLLEMMKMNGLSLVYYWVVNYLWNYIMFAIAGAIFLLFGIYFVDIAFFTQTSLFVLILVIFGWGLSQVSLSMFYQNFFSRARSATIAGYLLAIWTCLAATLVNLVIYPTPFRPPTWLLLYPPVGFSRLVYLMSMQCTYTGCIQDVTQLTGEMGECLAYLYIMAVVFLLVGVYLSQIWPQEFGIRKHPLFCLKRNYAKNNWRSSLEEQSIKEFIPEEGEDEDVRSEREYIQKLKLDQVQHPLIIKNIRKVYKSDGGKPKKVAVNCLSMHIEEGQMFGLLGPNGAGKTSLISMISGLYPPEGGCAWVGGYSIKTDIDMARCEMGVCPQFDLVWHDLSVEDHLYFYARLRGVPVSQEKELVKKAMAEVYLQNFANFKVRQLSGIIINFLKM